MQNGQYDHLNYFQSSLVFLSMCWKTDKLWVYTIEHFLFHHIEAYSREHEPQKNYEGLRD